MDQFKQKIACTNTNKGGWNGCHCLTCRVRPTKASARRIARKKLKKEMEKENE